MDDAASRQAIQGTKELQKDLHDEILAGQEERDLAGDVLQLVCIVHQLHVKEERVALRCGSEKLGYERRPQLGQLQDLEGQETFPRNLGGRVSKDKRDYP